MLCPQGPILSGLLGSRGAHALKSQPCSQAGLLSSFSQSSTAPGPQLGTCARYAQSPWLPSVCASMCPCVTMSSLGGHCIPAEPLHTDNSISSYQSGYSCARGWHHSSWIDLQDTGSSCMAPSFSQVTLADSPVLLGPCILFCKWNPSVPHSHWGLTPRGTVPQGAASWSSRRASLPSWTQLSHKLNIGLALHI